jgi:hypothetical protein
MLMARETVTGDTFASRAISARVTGPGALLLPFFGSSVIVGLLQNDLRFHFELDQALDRLVLEMSR